MRTLLLAFTMIMFASGAAAGQQRVQEENIQTAGSGIDTVRNIGSAILDLLDIESGASPEEVREILQTVLVGLNQRLERIEEDLDDIKMLLARLDERTRRDGE